MVRRESRFPQKGKGLVYTFFKKIHSLAFFLAIKVLYYNEMFLVARINSYILEIIFYYLLSLFFLKDFLNHPCFIFVLSFYTIKTFKNRWRA